MQTRPIQLTDVIYNAADQRFEALVTVHNGSTSRKYPCAISAPISMSFEDAARGLRTQAMRRDRQARGLYSEIHSAPLRPRAGRRSFDPIGWLDEIVQRAGRRAA